MPEIEVEFLGHASALIRCGKTVIVTDPWLTGTAFLGGWQRKYNPPAGWEEMLRNADLIYVSHAHSDHLSAETLYEAGNTTIVVPDFPKRSAEKAAKELHIECINPVGLGEWRTLGDCRLKIIKDNCPGHEDSGLIVEYKGKYLINTVDCSMPNGMDLPTENVEWLLAPFAGGSSPYPICYAPMYGSEKTEAIMKRNNDALLKKLLRLVELTRPKKLMPFAGAYVETERHFREKNLHNREEDIKVPCEVVLPRLDENFIEERPELLKADLSRDAAQEYFKDYDWTKRCLVITGYGEPFFIGTKGEETTIMHILNQDAFHHAMTRKLPIDELAIGYHILLSRIPDVYESEFWEYFNYR